MPPVSFDPKDLLARWSLGTAIKCEQRSQRAWYLETADGQGYYLKEHHDRQVVAADPVLRHLAAHGIRVEVPRPTADGSLLAESEGRYFALYDELPGDSLGSSNLQALPRSAHMLGAAIGQLHRGLASCSEDLVARLPRAHLQMDVIDGAGVVQATIAHSKAAWLSPVVAELSAALGDWTTRLPRHLVHNDCHTGNIIFDDCGAAGFVDFDFLRTNLRIFDPCYCLAGLLVEGLDLNDQAPSWGALMHHLLAGYESICCLQVAERTAITYVIWAALLINAGWWSNAGRPDLVGANLRALHWLTSNRS